MNLLGQQLQKAGLAFMSAKARHTIGGLRIDEIVCETAEDAAKILRDGVFNVGADVWSRIQNPHRFLKLKELRAVGYVKGRNRPRQLKVTPLGRRVLKEHEKKHASDG